MQGKTIIYLPEKLFNEIKMIYSDAINEEMICLIIDKISSKEFLVENIVKTPNNAVVNKRDRIILNPRYMKFLFIKCISLGKGIIVVHNHLDNININFSKSDISFLKKYNKYYIFNNGGVLFGGMLYVNGTLKSKVLDNNNLDILNEIIII